MDELNVLMSVLTGLALAVVVLTGWLEWRDRRVIMQLEREARQLRGASKVRG